MEVITSANQLKDYISAVEENRGVDWGVKWISEDIFKEFPDSFFEYYYIVMVGEFDRRNNAVTDIFENGDIIISRFMLPPGVAMTMDFQGVTSIIQLSRDFQPENFTVIWR